MLWIVAVSILLLLGVYLLLTPPQEDIDFDEPLPMASVPKAAAVAKSAAPAVPQSAPAGPLTVYFGSQTGTAEGFAKTLCAEAASHGFDATAMDLEDFELEQLAGSRMAIFAVATYGEGEPTDNAVRFLRTLKNSEDELEEDALAGLCYTTFGLGNRQYEVRARPAGRAAELSRAAHKPARALRPSLPRPPARRRRRARLPATAAAAAATAAAAALASSPPPHLPICRLRAMLAALQQDGP
jgi:sulfite reductase alpha subunit-like flavoprotein